MTARNSRGGTGVKAVEQQLELAKEKLWKK
jgi:hypothetical protein